MALILQTGTGKRGCRPEEFALYLPNLVYIHCPICDFDKWRLPLAQFNIKQPTQCPVCKEHWVEGLYIIHDTQLFEHRIIPNLNNRRIIVNVHPDNTITFGEEGLYSLEIFSVNDLTGIIPEFIKSVYLTDPVNLINNKFFDENILKVRIEDERAWKRASLYIYRVMNRIPDL